MISGPAINQLSLLYEEENTLHILFNVKIKPNIGPAQSSPFHQFVFSLTFRYNNSTDHDNSQYGGQDVTTTCVLRHCHGPVCNRLLLVCLRCPDGVCNIKFLLLQHQTTQLHGT